MSGADRTAAGRGAGFKPSGAAGVKRVRIGFDGVRTPTG
jgi:hypothetical protein